MGGKVHKVGLCYANRPNENGDWGSERDVAVILKDFTAGVGRLHEFRSRNQISYGSHLETKEYSFRDIMYLISKHKKSDMEFKTKMAKHYLDMFFFDAILANGDRHQNNWGYLIIGDRYEPAPIYDNGSAMFSRRTDYEDVGLEYSVFAAPKSKIGLDGIGAKAKHQNTFKRVIDEMKSSEYFSKAMNSFINRTGFLKVRESIYKATEHPLIPKDYVQFCRRTAQLRYLCLIEGWELDEAVEIVRKCDAGGRKVQEQVQPRATIKAEFIPVGLNLKTNMPNCSELHNRMYKGDLCSAQIVRSAEGRKLTVVNLRENVTMVMTQSSGVNYQAQIYMSTCGTKLMVSYWIGDRCVQALGGAFVSVKKVVETICSLCER